MSEIELLLAEVTELINNIVKVSLLTIEAVIAEIGEELSNFIWWVTGGIEWIVTELANMLYEVTNVSFYDIDNIVWMMSNYLYDIADDVIDSINHIVNLFTNITTLLITKVDTDLTTIDLQVTEHYQQRMFAIYGRIGQLSIAIDAPPSYLEEAIQNAKIFVLSVSSYTGLSWYQFQIDWDTGLTNLLNRISNSITLYRKNPQQIKVDLEQELIRPAYEIKLNSQRNRREQVNLVTENIRVLTNNIEDNFQEIVDIKNEAFLLWKETIEPELKQIIESLDNWKKYIYEPETDILRRAFVYVFEDLSRRAADIVNILKRFNFAGDILKRVDLLSDTERLLQEDKIAEVTSRTLRDNTDSWLSMAEEKRAE